MFSVSKFAKSSISDISLKHGECHVFNCNGEEFVFFAQTLQLYRLNNQYIKEFIRVCKLKNTFAESYLSKSELDQVSLFISQQLENNPKPDFSFSNKGINSLVLNISGTVCNLSCIYCFAFTNKSYDLPLMDFETAKKAIDLLISTSPEEKYYGIVFFGGEPFLNHKLIIEVANYCENAIIKKLGKRFSLNATTNGTILNKQLLDVFQKYPSDIFISLDGPDYIHNRNRPYDNNKKTFNKVMSNIELLKKYNIKHSFRPTITSDCNNLVAIVEFFEKLETDYYFEFTLKPNYKFSESAIFNADKIQNIKSQYSDLIEFFFEKVKRNEQIHCLNIISALKRIHFRKAKDYACAAGRSSLTVNSDGTIYSCQNLSNIFNANIGTLDSGFDKSKLEKFIAPEVDTLESCKDCWIKYLCSGSCFAEKYVENKSINIPLQHKCELQKMQWDKYLILYQKIKNIKPDYVENMRSIDAI